jgi:hypothetical protein
VLARGGVAVLRSWLLIAFGNGRWDPPQAPLARDMILGAVSVSSPLSPTYRTVLAVSEGQTIGRGRMEMSLKVVRAVVCKTARHPLPFPISIWAPEASFSLYSFSVPALFGPSAVALARRGTIRQRWIRPCPNNIILLHLFGQGSSILRKL